MATGWIPGNDFPSSPNNGTVVSPYVKGVLDLRWEDPSTLAENTAFIILGVNIYRSDVSDRGPYHRVNPYPVGGSFYRDRSDNIFIDREVVSWESWANPSVAPTHPKWVLQTRFPIVKREVHGLFDRPTNANAPTDVKLHIDGELVPVESVFGPTGEVKLIDKGRISNVDDKTIPAVLPTEDSEVLVSYYTNRNHIRSGLDAKIYYRLATVGIHPDNPDVVIETPLENCPPLANVAIEQLDYIWKEAIRRNNWILEQGGERVKVFVRKQSGPRCFCGRDARQVEYSAQPDNSCKYCYGTGFLGGYEGPYEVIIAPDDAERRISQGPTGRHMHHNYEVFMGPSPLLTQRDFIVKQTNERYSVGAVRRPTNRGAILQQHFTIAYIDSADIRSKVPISVSDLTFPETRTGHHIGPAGNESSWWASDGSGAQYPVGPNSTSPMTTEKSNIPDERQKRGRTPAWENIEY